MVDPFTHNAHESRTPSQHMTKLRQTNRRPNFNFHAGCNWQEPQAETMARVSEKALRPRQYVFNRLSPERMSQLRPAVRKLREEEQAALKSAREARATQERTEAARHAQNIMAGVQTPDPESDSIRGLQKELEELHEKKRRLFAQLKKSLDSGDAKREVVQEVIASPSGQAKREPTIDKGVSSISGAPTK